MSKDNILLIAYACEPGESSEPGVGWNFTNELAKDFNLWVVTRSNNREVIEKELNTRSDITVNWVYVDLSAPFRWLKKHIPLGIQFYYMVWQWKVFIKCRILVKEVDFALAHHLTFGITWLAPTTSMLKTPFIWGPIGGGDTVPIQYLLNERTPSIFQEALYFFLSRIICRISLLNLIARQRSEAILFRSRSVEGHFPKTKPENRYIISETASRACREFPTVKPDTINALCIGRHQYWKGYKYAVEGFCKYLAEGGTGVLRILGDGPEHDVLKRVHESYGAPDEIHFLGNVPHDKVMDHLEGSSVLIHPSFRDGGSWAVLESLSFGVPVVAQNASGMADIVTDECGIIVDTDHDKLCDGIAKALHRLSNDEALLEKLSLGALERIRNNYLWEKRGLDLKEIYRRITLRPLHHTKYDD